MKHTLLGLALYAVAATGAHAQAPACPPSGYDRAQLETLRANEFQIENRRARERFAHDLVACLASPDPFLRDQIAFEGLQHMLRAEQLRVPVRDQLTNEVLTMLRGPDPDGFARPFAALALSELVRADRINGYYTDDMYDEVVARAAEYMASVRDYRGFDETEGWRHGVAHGADLLMQIALDPNFNAPEHMVQVRDAVATQVAPEGHFYIYGEPERLARPILFVAARGAFTQAEWTQWFAQFAPAADENLYASQAGLARRHNLSAFLQAVWINARLSRSEADDVLLPGAEAALRAIP
ncbi:MAG: DUF2785 domain-containing protein [Hyphomonadaceae bacterium]